MPDVRVLVHLEAQDVTLIPTTWTPEAKVAAYEALAGVGGLRAGIDQQGD